MLLRRQPEKARIGGLRVSESSVTVRAACAPLLAPKIAKPPLPEPPKADRARSICGLPGGQESGHFPMQEIRSRLDKTRGPMTGPPRGALMRSPYRTICMGLLASGCALALI